MGSFEQKSDLEGVTRVNGGQIILFAPKLLEENHHQESSQWHIKCLGC